MKSDDELLRALARVAKENAEPRPEEARWEALVIGALTPEEEAELASLAREDDAAARKLEVYRPLAEDEKERIARRLQSVVAESKKVVPLRERRRNAAVPVAAGALALAAGVLLWMQLGARKEEPLALNDVPPYSVMAIGGDRATRSHQEPSAGDLELERASRLEFVLRPSTPITGSIAVKAFLVQGSSAHAWEPPMQISPDGAVRIAGQAGDLLGVSTGTWDVAFAVGRPNTLPADPAPVIARIAGEDKGPQRFQLFVRRIHLIAPR